MTRKPDGTSCMVRTAIRSSKRRELKPGQRSLKASEPVGDVGRKLTRRSGGFRSAAGRRMLHREALDRVRPLARRPKE